MTLEARNTHYSIADYLAHEHNARDKHEYRDGEILLMAGGTADHSLVIANVIRALGNHLTGKPCHVYDSNLRVRIPRTILYTYPDATVICGPRLLDPNDPTGETVTNPRLIVEVLSPSTEAYDPFQLSKQIVNSLVRHNSDRHIIEMLAVRKLRWIQPQRYLRLICQPNIPAGYRHPPISLLVSASPGGHLYFLG